MQRFIPVSENQKKLRSNSNNLQPPTPSPQLPQSGHVRILDWKKTPQKLKEKILKRAEFDVEKIRPIAREWIEKIKKEGDKAIISYTRQFDDSKFDLKNLRVKEKEFEEAFKKIDKKLLKAIEKQISISKSFHEKQIEKDFVLHESVQGVITGKKITPIDSVGLYVPAGLAPLPTVMQILGVAAKTAGVPRVIACFPPRFNAEAMLVAAKLAGVDEVYRVGGIAGIAAMAYGTKSIKPVLKIAGPGSPYVQAAKLEVFGKVSIDMLAGPSEAVILADESANPEFVAADILARCEHSPDASAVLITHDKALCEKVNLEIKKQLKKLDRKEITEKSLNNYTALILVKDLTEAIKLTNEYSPEHLEIQTKEPWEILSQIRNAGSIFLGDNAPVAIGDYASGTNHVLPTGNFPKMFSPVSVRTFQKESEVQYLTKNGLKNLWDIVDQVTRVEGLDGHRKSVKKRLER